MSEEIKTTTEEFSVLNLYPKEYETEENEAFFRDLNLTQIIDRITAQWGNGVRKYYMYLPDDAREGEYRRAVYGDIRKEAVYDALIAFTKRQEDIAQLRGKKGNTSHPLQKAVWELCEEEAYGDAYEELAKSLSRVELSSAGMRQFLRILTEFLGSEQFNKFREQARVILGELRKMRFVVTYEKDRMSIELREEQGDGEYEEWLDSFDARADMRLLNPFGEDSAITELEQACLEIIESKKKKLFRALWSVAEQERNYINPVLSRFEQEVIFYLSYATLQRDTEREGFPFATPDTSGKGRMEAGGLYDLALALVSIPEGRKVIPNDFYYGEGDRFFVLTGPNQGGKTTFARSLGQLVYLTRMGLDVPAESASVPYFPKIQTHFSVEESVETGRGKLMEELVRLAPMMEDHKRGSFVVINELFTTAANYDAQIMGKRVLEHFLELGCMGIYVTHIKELAEGRDGVVSLRAMLNDSGYQTFEIRRAEAEDVACAANQVNKYRLTYDQLKERL